MYPKSTKDTTEQGEITRFWRHIFGGQKGLLQVWTGIPDDTGSIPEETIRRQFFNYPEAADSAAQWALKKSEEEGREVYFCAHLLSAAKRIKENAAEIVTLWGDLDGAHVPNGTLTPTAVVESSPGKYHCYWRLSKPVLPQVAEELTKSLASKVGADPSGVDLTQLLRVPLTTNNKYPDKPTVTLKRLDGAREYSLEELCSALPEVEEQQATHQPEDQGDEPPVDLDKESLKVWRGEKPKYKDTGELDRSTSLMKIGRVLYDAGANKRVVVDELARRDKALGWNKYTGNRDGGQREYERIFEKLGKTGRTARVTHRGAPIRYASNDSNVSNDSDFRDLDNLPDPARFPSEVLPGDIGRFVEEGAASIGCPVDFVGLSVLAAVSAAIGGTRQVVLKKRWRESAALYCMIIGPSGSKKTPAMKLALAPIQSRQIELKVDYERDKQEYRAELADYAKAIKEGNTDVSEPRKPTLKRTWVDDTTVERLGDLLEETPRGVIVGKDELSGWLGGMNQYKQGGKGSDRQFWLSAHDNTATAVDRKSTDEPRIIERPFVTILGGIQPDVLPDFGKDRGDGLMERFTPVYPEPTVTGWTDAEISDEALKAYESTIANLYNRLGYARDSEGVGFPKTVPLTDEAKQLFIAQYNELTTEASTPGFPERLQPVWSKLEGRLARIALIISTLRHVNALEGGDLVYEAITLADMQGAVKLLDYFKNHLRRVFSGLYSDNVADRLAADLKDFLERQGGVWEGIASELHGALASDYKPKRPEDLAKAVRGIAKRSPLLALEELQRTTQRRPIRLKLKNAVIADIAVMATYKADKHRGNPNDSDYDSNEEAAVIIPTAANSKSKDY